MREAYKDGTPEELEAAKAKYKEAEARYIKELEKNETIKIKIEILKANAAQALLAEIIGTICDIWNKYEGKPHGEKTADKIRNELKAVTGYYISIGNKWRDARISIYFDYKSPAPFRDLEFCPVWNVNASARLIIFPALYFDGVAIDTNGDPVGIFTERDNDGNEKSTAFLKLRN